ncbi:hypothetical protein EYE42_05460 [Paracoccus subflavus]|uniref:Mth938-like domain-containing protein n=1 Tax=Paracoccus subflavus TaxID=2528244 RepID=A0A4Q9G5F9_9RHOB|nr:Mth938-like domain-containing protein [Paracoccus subflavus]TBN41854.1 hypothetical protein EYE42_05460 [Paracoccus subflavus]
MKMKPTDFGGATAVEGYGPGFFRMGRTVIHGPVLVTAAGGVAWGGLEDQAPLLALAGQIDVLFIGMGAEVAHAPTGLVAALREAGVAVESMSSPTAARTYNVTLSEGRRVACALLPL